jgi:hypothetical protein
MGGNLPAVRHGRGDGRWEMEDGRWEMEELRWKREEGRGNLPAVRHVREAALRLVEDFTN